MTKTTAAGILQAGLKHMEDRASTYDKPEGERSMGRTVAAFNAVTGHTLTEEHGWLLLGLLKMVRSQQGDLRMDNYEDEAAYAALRGECAARERTARPVAHPMTPHVFDFDEDRVDRVASSHGDGEHYAEFSFREPERPKHICPACSGGHSLHRCSTVHYPTDGVS
ncbi:hypothetical protein D3C76_47670 [compost metagenome]